jgi:hypothetical protein
MIKPIKDIAFLKSLLTDEVYWAKEHKRYPLIVLIHEPKDEYLLPEEEAFLEKVLGAVHIDLETVKVINTAFLQPEDDFGSLQNMPSEKIINFGADWQKVNLKINPPKYKPIPSGQVQVLNADALTEINLSKELKKQLWEGLKEMFFNESV